MPPSLIVTTSHNLAPDRHERADQVATRCGVKRVARSGSLPLLFEQTGAELLYVVEADREVLLAREGGSIGVDEGMLKTRLHAGANHPLIRAIAPTPVDRIVDATLGLAADALHLTAALEVPLIGTEISPVVFCLLEGGLARLRRGPDPAASAAQRIEARCVDARSCLETLGPDSVDVVYLAPMFSEPKRAVPGYPLFRKIAHGATLDAATLDAARTAARQRVVLKLAKGEEAPDCWPSGEDRVVLGKAVAYRVWETG